MARGIVAAFDEHRGLGTIRADDGDHRFHCTQIEDGSRSVRVGQAVEFEVVPGRLGDWEAARIEKIDPAGGS
jgi:cold shock CspA family protein